MPATKAPKIWLRIKGGTLRHGKPLQIARQNVTAGLKWPPETGANKMMASVIPTPKARPIWKRDPKAAAPTGVSIFKVKEATDAIPGRLQNTVSI